MGFIRHRRANEPDPPEQNPSRPTPKQDHKASENTSPSTQKPAQETSQVNTVKRGGVELVTINGAAVFENLAHKRASISFKKDYVSRFMGRFVQAFTLLGPILYALGTVSEVFIFLWSRQTQQDWYVAVAIISASIIVEGSLLAVSYQAHGARAKIDRQGDTPSPKDKKYLWSLFWAWLVLSLLVAATQIAFVLAQTKADGLSPAGLWTFAIVRSLAALASDFTTAFITREKETSGEEAIIEEKKATEWTQQSLAQEAIKIETINDGVMKVDAIAQRAELQQVELEAEKVLKREESETRIAIAREENKAKLEAIRAEHEENQVFARMKISTLRAYFDPDMPDEQRQRIIGAMGALASAYRPQPNIVITPIDPTSIGEGQKGEY